MAAREVIYVRGGKERNPTPALQVWRFAHPRGPRTNTALTLFDYAEKRLKRWPAWNGDQPPQTPPATAVPITHVRDLYNYIKGLGSTAPGSVTELHFFTHGSYDGSPVLVDTWDLLNDPAQRDPTDVDPRIKDFRIPSVLGGANGTLFKRAFASTALVKLWGCSHDESFIDILRNGYFGRTNAAAKRRAKEAYQQKIRDGTYQFALHKAIGLPVYAPPLGWGTNPYLPAPNAPYRGRWPPGRTDLWWRVPPSFQLQRGDLFYRRVLGATIDPTGYVAYTDGLVTASFIDVTGETDDTLAAAYPDDYPA